MTLGRSVSKVIAAWAATGFLLVLTGPSRTFSAEAPPWAAGVDPARAAREVFQDSDYWWKEIETRRVSTSWLQSILTAVLEGIVRILGKILDWLAELQKILSSLFGIFTGDMSKGKGVIWLIIAALLAWSIWRLYPVIVRWLRGVGTPALSMQEGVTCEILAEASELFEQAGQAFRDGKYAEAIRLALLALIARLEKQGLLRYDTTRTNREYQMELRPRSELAALFGQLARIYERVWYGRMSAGRAEAEQAIDLCGSVINREERVSG